MAQGIFLIQPDESIVELQEQPYDSEDLLQRLLARYPDLLKGESRQGAPRRWLLVRREMPIPDAEKGADRWALDHLFLDSNAVPTLVEVKRASDTRARREVVAQMLDYAANAILHWPIDRIQSEFQATAEKNGKDPDKLLREFLGEATEPEKFWQDVQNNLQTGYLRLVFVADQISPELRSIVEFLNKQMNPAEVIAIEVKQFIGQGIRSLVPHVIGETVESEIRKSTGSKKRQWDETSFFATFEERNRPHELSIAQKIFQWASKNGLRIAWGAGFGDGSFFPMFDYQGHNIYTFCVRTGWKNGYIQLQFGQLIRPFDELERRKELADRIQKAISIRLKDADLTKYPGIMFSELDDKKLEAFLAVFDWYLKICREEI